MSRATFVDRLEQLDVDSLDAGGVSAAVRELQRVKGFVADLEHRLARLVPGCQRHHHAVHEGGWQLDLDPATRELTVTLPDGTVPSRSRSRPVTAPTVGRVA